MGVGARIATAARIDGPALTADQPGDLFEPSRDAANVFVFGTVRLYRDALVRLLGDEPSIHVLGEADGDVGAGIASMARLRLDVVLVDVSTVKERLAIAAIVEAAPAARVVAFGVPDSETEIVALAQAGVVGFVSHRQPLADLVAAIQFARRGEVFSSPSVTAALLHRVAAMGSGSGTRPAAAALLTARELEIVDLIDAGLTNRQIARHLCIEVATVKNHVHNILEKLQATDRTEAAARVRSTAV